MSKMRRLLTVNDDLVTVLIPVSNEELKIREELYDKLTPMQFSKRLIDSWTEPVTLIYQGEKYEIQMNFCSNPFCRLFGQTQLQYSTLPYKPSRYKLVGDKDSKRISCQADPAKTKNVPVFVGEQTTVYSNWGIADEIARLIRNSSVIEVTPDYEFHTQGCALSGTTPFDNPENFIRNGRSKAKSQQWRCNECKTYTNVLPERHERFTYHQKRDDTLVQIAKCIIGKVGVRRTCEMVGIGYSTYYKKAEQIYQRSLEFLERHETQKLKKLEFKSIWINTDQLLYYLNNTKNKGFGGVKFDEDDPKLQTHIIASADVRSWYVFRADVAHDWDYTFKDLEYHTFDYKEDHLPTYARKNDRLQYITPVPPSLNDTQTREEYDKERDEYAQYKSVVNGIGIDQTYTAIAHFWLLRKLITSKYWNIISDNDGALRNGFYKVFTKEILDGFANHFLYKIIAKKDELTAAEHLQYKEVLLSWARKSGITIPKSGLGDIPKLWLAQQLRDNPIYDFVEEDGIKHPYYNKSFVKHPIATSDRGYLHVGCTTDLSYMSSEELARKLLKVDNASIDNFFQAVRRRISILERPIMTARADRKTYIYSNVNPKYAQQDLTYFRTFYNFCAPFGNVDKSKKKTPAQRLGIVDRCYSIEDILYFK